jgi:phosphatidylserine/phosphatidylglycerophosphate/cardiolipin synthase-like enzyme
MAIYHLQLSGDPHDASSPLGKVEAALNADAERGVNVRLGIFDQKDKNGDPSINTNIDPKDLNSNIQLEGIDAPGSQLMHDKYMVRDAGTPDASIWTGSTNFTDDAFGSQENNIIQMKSPDIAGVYENDFQQMWDSHNISDTGKGLMQSAQVGDSQVTVAFSPGDGAQIDSEIANKIMGANESVHIASMDISSEKVLAALAHQIDEGHQVDGIYDGSQMDNPVRAWEKSNSADSQEKLKLWDEVKGHLVEKHSLPYKEGQLANFMHDKAVDIDDSTVITGSFNFSSNATKNAENILEIANPDIAKQYGNYIGDLVNTYGGDQANAKT